MSVFWRGPMTSGGGDRPPLWPYLIPIAVLVLWVLVNR